jgi:hypothetical protein
MGTNPSYPAPCFIAGQVWQLGESQLRIELVGKTLVHYKLIKMPNRGRIILASHAVLAEFLRSKNAVPGT